MKAFLERLNKYWATPAIAIVGGVLSLYFTVVKDQLEAEAKKIENVAKKMEAELIQREFNNNLKIQMYGEVKQAIVSEDKKLQNAVLLLVNEILSDDTLFREQLITILMASPNIDETVKKEQVAIEQKTVEFKKDEVEKLVNEFTVDVFYLEDVLRESEPGAKRVMTALQSAYPDQRIRLRRLPRHINAKKNYRISENEIRFEPGEKKWAERVLSVINESNIFEGDQLVMREITPNTPTPNYISVFIRNK